jgi:hypothetical protein
MNFRCPFCQLLMTAPTGFQGGQVQCAGCQQVFMVGSMMPTMPVVQPEHAYAPQAQPARPAVPPARSPGQPQVPRGPQAAGTRQPQKPGASGPPKAKAP